MKRSSFHRGSAAASALVGLLMPSCNLVYGLDGYDDGKAADDAGARSSYAAEVLADHPTVYFRLGEPSGSSAKEETGKSPGEYRSVKLAVPGAIAADSNTAARFTTGSSVLLGQAFEIAGDSAFTIEVWAKPSTIDKNNRRIVTKRVADGAQDNGWSLVHDETTNLTFETYLDAKWAGGLTDHPLPLDVYTHVVLTYDKHALRFYLDGSRVKEFVTTIRLRGNPGDLTIGAFSGGDGNHWMGDLDEFALYSDALSEERITAHFRAGRPR